MLRMIVKGIVEASRWRWLNMESALKGISNITIRTIVTTLWFVVQFVISDILFGWLWLVLMLSKKYQQWLEEKVIERNIQKYDFVLSWKEES